MDESKATPGQLKRADELVRLAEEEFGELLEGEVKMLRGTAMGKEVELASGEQDEILLWNAENAHEFEWGCWDKWATNRTVRADLLRWLCSNSESKKLIDSFGIVVNDGLLDGKLDLDGVEFPLRLALIRCAIPGGITANDSDFLMLSLFGSVVLNILANRIKISGGVHLNCGFVSLYEVGLSGSKIGGTLDCSGGQFLESTSISLSIEKAKIQGGVFLRSNFLASGEVRLMGAEISGDLDCCQGKFLLRNGKSINLQGACVGGAFAFHPSVCYGEADLTCLKVEHLVDLLSLWPRKIRLVEFKYESIHPDGIGSLEGRLDWLNRHDKTTFRLGSRFNPQPYRQFAKVIRHSGHGSFANEILYVASKKSAEAQLARLDEMERWWGSKIFTVWYWLLDHLIGFGYRRWLPLRAMVLMIAIGALIFSDFDPKDLVWLTSDPYPGGMQPTQARAAADAVEGQAWLEGYPVFRPIAYSMDTFLPLVNLHQESYWTPKDGWVKRFYLPFHILSGWVVTTLAAVSVTGLVRHEKE